MLCWRKPLNRDSKKTPDTAIGERKKELRREIRRRIKELPEEQLQREGELCAEALFELGEWRKAVSVLVFVSMKGELPTDTIIQRALQEGKRVALPKMHGETMYFHLMEVLHSRLEEQLVRHPYGILEPPADTPIFSDRIKNGHEEDLPALIVTPGLAFDKMGRRLGRGKAYYDKWFSMMDGYVEKGLLNPVAVGYSVQLVEEVPTDEGDHRVPLLDIAGTLIRTEKGVE